MISPFHGLTRPVARSSSIRATRSACAAASGVEQIRAPGVSTRDGGEFLSLGGALEGGHLAERLHEGAPHHFATGGVEPGVGHGERLLRAGGQDPEEFQLPPVPLGAELERHAGLRDRGALRLVEERRAGRPHREAAHLESHQEEVVEAAIHRREALEHRHAAAGRRPERQFVVEQVVQLGVEARSASSGASAAPQPSSASTHCPATSVSPFHPARSSRTTSNRSPGTLRSASSSSTDRRSGSGAARRATRRAGGAHRARGPVPRTGRRRHSAPPPRPADGRGPVLESLTRRSNPIALTSRAWMSFAK